VLHEEMLEVSGRLYEGFYEYKRRATFLGAQPTTARQRHRTTEARPRLRHFTDGEIERGIAAAADLLTGRSPGTLTRARPRFVTRT
jgi:hypothetical protein